MAGLDARTESFVAMVLSVNGRVRPADLTTVPQSDRLDVLRAFAEAHVSDGIGFDGDILVAGAPPADPGYEAPVAVGSPEPAPTAAPSPQDAAVETSAPATIAPDETDAPIEPGANAVAMPVPAAPAVALAEPDAAQPSQLAPEPMPAPVGFESAAESPAGGPNRVSILWWALAVLVPVVGGIVSWFAVKGRNARQATAMLVVSLVLGVLLAGGFFLVSSTLGVMVSNFGQPSVINVPAQNSTATPSAGASAPAGEPVAP